MEIAAYNLEKISQALIQLESKYGNKNKAEKVNIGDYKQLLLFKNILEDILDPFNALEKFSGSKNNAFFHGWVERGKEKRVKNAVKAVTDKKGIVIEYEPQHNEEPPTLLNNPQPIKPFEIFVENYGVPSYWEIDPTPIVALTFIIFFGLMFADAGYGLTLSILSLFVYFLTTKESRLRKQINLVAIYLGFSSAFFGFLFGEFFGFAFRKGIIDPLKDIVIFLEVSIIIGLIHLSIGIISKTIIEKNKKKILQNIVLISILWSSFLLYYQSGMLPYQIIFPLLLVSFLFLKKLEALKDLLLVFTAVISYARIAILGVVHIIISRLLISLYPGLSNNVFENIAFAVLFIAGIIIVLLVGVFLAGLQTLRLHWVEFFPHSYIGKGYKFEPFEHKNRM